MPDTHLPIVNFPVCFNVDPFDPAPPAPVWTDLAPLVTGVSSAQRGRQYELDTNQTGAMELSLIDRSETYNPLNTGSAVSPNVQPYRQIRAYATWPNPAPGNLFNLLYNKTDGGFESYTNGQTLPWTVGTGNNSTPTVTTVNPRTGTKCATFINTAAAQAVQWYFNIPTVPGSQYTASLWVRQDQANSLFLFINGGVSGSAAATTGAYFRLTVTFTATTNVHLLVLNCNSTVAASNYWVDDIQLDVGAAALTNTTTGGLQRSFWTSGYVERWPTNWSFQGFQGQRSLPCVGPFFALQNAKLHAELKGAILAKAPNYYWPLTESGSDVTTFGEISGNKGPSLTRFDSKYGPGTFDTGATINVLGAPGDGGVHQINGVGGTQATTILTAGQNGTTPVVGPSGGTFSYTIAFVMSRPVWHQTDSYLTLWDGGYGAPNLQFGGFTGTKLLWISSSVGTFTDFWADGKPHLYILTVSAVAGSWTLNAYVDNTQPLVNGVTAFGNTALAAGWMQVGATIGFTGQPFSGFDQQQTTLHLALWNRVITGPERADLYNAFVGYKGELTGVRMRRWLTSVGLSGLTGDIQDGVSATGPSDAEDGQVMLDAGQGLAQMEFGNFYESQTGIAYRGRSDRYLKTVPSIILGERADLGEYPYQTEDFEIDFDPTNVYNYADVGRKGGQSAHAEDLASQKRFGRKVFGPVEYNYLTDSDAVDAANFIVNYYKIARPRVTQVTIDVATGRITGSDGTMWPGVLQLEIGQLARVMRRAKAANSGAGITIQQDYFIENIDHGSIDFEAGTWQVTLQLSPALTVRPWILEDATYGLLESTTYLAF